MGVAGNAEFTKEKAGLASGPRGDEVYTPAPRRSEGQHGQLGRSLFEPRCEQNLYANPKRTAKSFRHTVSDSKNLAFVQKF